MTDRSHRSTAWGLGAAAGFVGIALGLGAIDRLTALLLDGTLRVPLETTRSSGATLASDVGDLPLAGTLTVAVPADELGASSIALVVVADVVLALGALVATFALATALNHVVDPRLDARRAVGLLGWTLGILAATFVVAGLGSMVGALLVTDDLGLSSYDNGITLTTLLAAMGTLGVIAVLRHVLTRALAAEADTEGLV